MTDKPDTNTGHANHGNRNSGNHNEGDRNSGQSNHGYRNSGHSNTGKINSGDSNRGARNTGDSNTGNCNSGHLNTGDRNSGDYNCGYNNAGDYNRGDRNNGFFNVGTPAPTFFGQPTYMSWGEAHNRIPDIDLPEVCEWVTTANMTSKEREAHPSHTTTGGYLRSHGMSLIKSFPLAWAKMTEKERAKWRALPNFCPVKFLTITGVDLRATDRKAEIHAELDKHHGAITRSRAEIEALEAELEHLTN